MFLIKKSNFLFKIVIIYGAHFVSRRGTIQTLVIFNNDSIMPDPGFSLNKPPEKNSTYHSAVTKDVESVYRTLVSPVGANTVLLDDQRINEKGEPFSRYFSEEERLGDSQGVELLKRKFNESENVKAEVLEGHIFGKVLDALLHNSFTSTFPSEGAVRVTSEYDDYINRTDFVVNLSEQGAAPRFLLIDTTAQTATDNLRKKILPKREKSLPHEGFRQNIKYFVDENENIGLINRPRIVVSLSHENIALLCKKFVDKERGDFSRVSSFVFLNQVLWQLGRQQSYTEENMTKFRDAGVLIGEYREYVAAVEKAIGPLRDLFSNDPEIKALIEKTPIQEVMTAIFPIQADRVASMDDLAEYRKKYTPPTVEKQQPQASYLSGGNPILKLKKKNPPGPSGENVVNA